MQGGVEVIDGARGCDEFFGGGLVGAARIGKRCGGSFQTIEIANAGFIGDGEHDNVASFFAVADREHAHSRAGRGQGTSIGVGLFGAQQFSRRAHDAAQKFLGRRNGGRLRNVRDPGRNKVRIGGGGRDRFDRAGFGNVGALREWRGRSGTQATISTATEVGTWGLLRSIEAKV